MNSLISLLKSCDTYYRDILVSSNNSTIRGLFNVLLVLLFVLVNIYYFYDNFNNQKPKEIKEPSTIYNQMIDIDDIKLEITVGLKEHYHMEKPFDACISTPYIELYNKNIVIDVHEDDMPVGDIVNYKVVFNVTKNDIKEDRLLKYNFRIKNNCTDDRIFMTEAKFVIYENVTSNKLKLNGKTNKELFMHDYSVEIYNLEPTKQYVLFDYFKFIFLYDDFKSYLDFNEYSNFFMSNYQSNSLSFLKPSNHILEFVKSSINENEKTDNLILDYYVYINNQSTIYVRVYNNFLYLFPIIFNAASILVQILVILNSMIRYNYQYNELINGGCSIRFNYNDCFVKDRKSLNKSSNSNESGLAVSKSNLDNDIISILRENNKDIRNTHGSIENIQTDVKNNDSKKLDYDCTDNFKEKQKCLLACEMKLKNYDTSSELKSRKTQNLLTFGFIDSLCFFIPYEFCRSKTVNIKYKILKDLKTKLYHEKPSFHSLTNKSITYIIHKNLLNILGNDLLLKPIYNYDLNDYDL